jgi:hypothetical protein
MDLYRQAIGRLITILIVRRDTRFIRVQVAVLFSRGSLSRGRKLKKYLAARISIQE